MFTPAGRHRRLRQERLHRLQGVHRRLPLRRDLHQPRGPLGGEVQLLRPPASTSAWSRPASSSARPRRSWSATSTTRPRGSRRSSTASRRRCAARRRRRGRSSSTRARTRRRSTRSPRARPDGGLYMWSEQDATAPMLVGPAIRATPTAPRRPFSPTTCRTARRGTGGSASTPGPRASPRAPTSSPLLLILAGVISDAGAAVALGGAAPRAGFLALTGAAPVWRPRAPAPLLLHLHPAAVAELAGPRRGLISGYGLVLAVHHPGRARWRWRRCGGARRLASAPRRSPGCRSPS